MRRLVWTVTSLLASAAFAAPASAHQPVIALTSGGDLITVDAAAPGTVISRLAYSGLPAGEGLVAIDVRPSTGKLYGLSGHGEIYRVDRESGRCTRLSGHLSPPPPGPGIGFDFDPVRDVARIVGEDGTNVRFDLETGAVTKDAALPGDLAAIAYTDDHDAATSATLYGIDSTDDRLVRVGGPGGSPSPDAGDVTPLGAGLGLNTSGAAGLDVAAPTGVAYALLTLPSGQALHTIDLATGQATTVGTIGGNAILRDIAVLPAAPDMLGLGTGNTLVAFNAATPGTTSVRAITGLPGGELLRGLDVRPATGDLLALGTADGGRLYRVDAATGAATAVGAPFAVALQGTSWGFEVDPAGDRVRITSDSGQNLRVDPATGAVVDADPSSPAIEPDTPLGLAGGLTAVAHTGAFPRAATSAAFGLDLAGDGLVRLGGATGSPSSGVTAPIGSFGVDLHAPAALEAGPEDVLLATAAEGGATRLFVLARPTGGALGVGTVGAGAALHGVAALPPGDLSIVSRKVAETAGEAEITVRRTHGGAGRVTVEARALPSSASTADFAPVDALLEFAPGQTEQTFSVPVRDDDGLESEEQVELRLTDPTNGASDVSGDGALTILSDDVAPPPAAKPVPSGHGTPTGGQPGATDPAPRITAARMAPNAFAPGLRRGRRGRPRRTAFLFRLSEDAAVSIRIDRLQTGKKARRACRAKGRGAKGRGAARCTVATQVGMLRRDARSGANRVAFDGRLGGTIMHPGRYRATITARDTAGQAARPVTLTFRVTPR